MAVPPLFKVSWRTFFNPVAWFGYNELKNNTQVVTSALQTLFKTAQPLYTETFEEAMKRQGLLEADIEARQKSFRAYAFIFVCCGLLVFAYSFYLLFAYTRMAAFALGIATSALFFSQAFKFDFWAMQLRERRLGATFAEWKQCFLGGKGRGK